MRHRWGHLLERLFVAFEKSFMTKQSVQMRLRPHVKHQPAGRTVVGETMQQGRAAVAAGKPLRDTLIQLTAEYSTSARELSMLAAPFNSTRFPALEAYGEGGDGKPGLEVLFSLSRRQYHPQAGGELRVHFHRRRLHTPDVPRDEGFVFGKPQGSALLRAPTGLYHVHLLNTSIVSKEVSW